MMKPDTPKGGYCPPAVEEITLTAECLNKQSPQAQRENYTLIDLFAEPEP